MIFQRKLWEVPHTGDIAVYVKGKTFTNLLKNASCKLLKVAGVKKGRILSLSEEIIINGFDCESYLINFLNELLLYLDLNIVCVPIKYFKQEAHMTIIVKQYKLISVNRSIKAATYHNLKIKKDNKGMSTIIVFDV